MTHETALKCAHVARHLALAAATSLAVVASVHAGSIGNEPATWATGGEDAANTRNNGHANLKPADVANIALAWEYQFRGDPWTQPTVAWGKVFVGDNVGWLYALDAATGELVWERELKNYWDNPGPDNATNDANDINDPDNLFPNPKPDIAATRTAPAARYSRRHGRVLYIGDQAGNPTLANPDLTTVPFNGANIYMIDADNGDLIAMTKVAQNDRPPPYPASTGSDFTVLTGALAIAGDTIITGVAGLAEANPACAPLTEGGCTLRGRVMAFDADSLKLKWETYTTPDRPGYTGASVWQSTPAVDRRRGLVFVGTGDNYTTPHDTCFINIDKVDSDGNRRTYEDVTAEFLDVCIGDEFAEEWARNHVDSILALDLESGDIVWNLRTLDYDTWNLACLNEDWRDTCGPDMDFSHHPMLCGANSGNGKGRDVLVVGQKTGEMRGLDPASGAVLWKTSGNDFGKFKDGLVGGFQWGAACTRGTVIGLAANSYAQPHTTQDGIETRGGTLVGFDVATGEVQYETLPDTLDEVHPGLQSLAATLRGLPPAEPGDAPATIGAASCAGRVCGWGTSGTHGSLLLTDVETGETLWSRDTANGSVLWGGAIVRLPGAGLMWLVGSGYRSFDTGVGADGETPNFWAYSFAKPKPRGRGRGR